MVSRSSGGIGICAKSPRGLLFMAFSCILEKEDRGSNHWVLWTVLQHVFVQRYAPMSSFYALALLSSSHLAFALAYKRAMGY